MYTGKDQCIDVGQKVCPCRLASSGRCLTCSLLSGKDKCDCDWQGVCVYNEFMQNGCRRPAMRRGQLYEVVNKRWYMDDFAEIQICVPRGVAQQAAVPGSCVFIRPENEGSAFDTPISVLRADVEHGTIDMAVKAVGVKSRAVLEAGRLLVRGVYSNGLRNVERLLTMKRKRVLCITKGTGLAPAVNYCNWNRGRDDVDFLIDTDKVGVEFCENCLKNLSYKKAIYKSLAGIHEEVCPDDYDVVAVCASDYYRSVVNVPQDKLVFSNNTVMNCGEGICGACIYIDDNGNAHKMCKCKKIK